MTFHPYSPPCATDLYLQGFWNDGFPYSQYPRENYHSHPSSHDHTLPVPQNFSLNFHSSNIAPRFLVPPLALPYADHLRLPVACLNDSWANGCSPALPEGSRQFLNNSVHNRYDAWSSVTLPETARPRFLHQRCDREHTNEQPSAANDRCSDSGSAEGTHTAVTFPRVRHAGYCTNQFEAKEPNNCTLGCSLSPPYSHSVGEIVCGTETPAARRRSRDGDVFNIFSPSPFQKCTKSPTSVQHSFAQQNFAPNTGMSSHGRAGVSFAVDHSKEVCCENRIPVGTFLDTRRTYVGCQGHDGRIRYADCCFSRSAAFSPSVEQANTFFTNSHASVLHSRCQTREESVLLTPTMHTANLYDSQCVECDQKAHYPMNPDQDNMDVAGVEDNSSFGQGLPMKENEQVHPRKAEAAEVFTFNVSDSPYYGSCVASKDTSGATSTVTIPSAVPLEMNMIQKYSSTCREMASEGKETDSHAAMTDKSEQLSTECEDDVIVISPLPIMPENTTPHSVNGTISAVTLCDTKVQTTCVHSSQKYNHTYSEFHQLVPNSEPSTFPRVNTGTVAESRHRFSTSAPWSSHDFSKYGDCEPSRSHAKHVANSRSVRATSCSKSQRSTPHVPVSSRTVTNSDGSRVHHSPVMVVSAQEWCEKSPQSELQRLMEMNPPRLNGARSLLRTAATGHQYACAPMSRLMPRQPTKQHFDSARSAIRFGRSDSASRALHNFTLAGCNKRTTGFETNCQPPGLPADTRIGSVSQLNDVSARKRGTFSVPAARQLLQRLKQPKLSDLTSARANHRLPVNQRFYPLFRRTVSRPADQSVIDLTTDDDDEASCESTFARTRWHDAGRRRRRYMQWKWIRRNRTAIDSSCHMHPVHCHDKNEFSVDKSLAFYRCFVEKLLRNYKLGRSCLSRLPARISPELPPAATRPMHSTDTAAPSSSKTCKHFACTIQPVVVLERLDRSVLEQVHSGKTAALRLNGSPLDASPEGCSQSCISAMISSSEGFCQLKASEDESTETLEDARHAETETCLGLATASVADTDVASSSKENAVVKTCRNDDVFSLCQPLSVVLERLDENEIQQLCRSKDSSSECDPRNDRKQLAVEPTSWTVTRIQRPGSGPILIMRMPVLRAVDRSHRGAARHGCDPPASSERRLSNAMSESPTNHRISRAAGQVDDHLAAHSSQRSEMLRKRSSKKSACCRKLSKRQRFVFPNFRSSRYTRHCRCRAPVSEFLRSVSSRWRCVKQPKLALLSTRCNDAEKVRSESPAIAHELPSCVNPVDSDIVPSVPPELSPENSAPTDVPMHDSGIGEDLVEDGDETSDSNTICASSPRSVPGADAMRSPLCANFDDECTQDLVEWSEVSVPERNCDNVDGSLELQRSSRSVFDTWNCGQVDSQPTVCRSPFCADFDDESTQDMLEWSEINAPAVSSDNGDSSLELKSGSGSVCDIRNCGNIRRQHIIQRSSDTSATRPDVRVGPVEFSSNRMESSPRKGIFTVPVQEASVNSEVTCCQLDTWMADDMEGPTLANNDWSGLGGRTQNRFLDSVGDPENCVKTSRLADATEEVVRAADRSVGRVDHREVGVPQIDDRATTETAVSTRLPRATEPARDGDVASVGSI